MPAGNKQNLANQLCALLAPQGQSVVGLVPLTEGGRINDDDGILHKGLGTDELVVGGVVDNVDDTGLPGAGWLKGK